MSGSLEDSRATEWWRYGRAELLDRVAGAERAIRRAHTDLLRGIAEIDARGVAGEVGYRDTESLVGDVLAVTRADAIRLVGQAQQLSRLPVLAAAAEEGALHSDQITAITDTLTKLPAWATLEDHLSTEKILTDAAPALHARALRRLGREILSRIDQDGPEPSEVELAHPDNEAHIMVKPSGRVRVVAEFEPITGTSLTSMLSALTTPTPSSEGEPDLRTPSQRTGDALADIIHRCADTGALPEDGGQKPHVVVTASLDTLRDNLGRAILDTATPEGTLSLTASQARRLACDAHLIPLVLGSRSEPLDIGRTTRTVPTAMRKAVIFRDKGCTFPACDRPPQWCDAHHIHHVLDGGPTSLANLALLCRRHHTLIHHTDWHITMDTDGIPTFIPPTYIDPDQKPRVNLLHRQPLPT